MKLTKEVPNNRKVKLFLNNKNLSVRLSKDYMDILKWKKGDMVSLNVIDKNHIIVEKIGD